MCQLLSAVYAKTFNVRTKIIIRIYTSETAVAMKASCAGQQQQHFSYMIYMLRMKINWFVLIAFYLVQIFHLETYSPKVLFL